MQEIFSLAYYLHWSRDDVLSLSILERRDYLQLLAEQLKREQPAHDLSLE
jgi:hypothetical protein